LLNGEAADFLVDYVLVLIARVNWICPELRNLQSLACGQENSLMRK
jgi:hypothetical protein